MPPTPGTLRKYLLQNSSDVNRMSTMEPIIEPIVCPDALQVDA